MIASTHDTRLVIRTAAFLCKKFDLSFTVFERAMGSVIPLAFLQLLSASLVYLVLAKNGSHCFPGLHPCKCSTNKCCCNRDVFGGKVLCHSDGTLKSCCHFLCVTYDKSSDTIVAGECPYYRVKVLGSNHSRVFPKVFPEQHKMTETMCGRINRTGMHALW